MSSTKSWQELGLQPSRELLEQGYVPHLSLAERDRRWEAVRKRMALRGLDALLLHGNDQLWGMGMGNIRYLTQVGSLHGAWAVFPLEGEVTVFNSPPHLNVPFNAYLGAQDWVQDIRPFQGITRLANELKARGFERGHIGVVGVGNPVMGQIISHRSFTQLLENLPNAIISDESVLVDEIRMYKSPEEIAMLRKSAAIARLVVDAMIETASVGVKECEVYAEMLRAQIANGAEPQTFNLLTSGSVKPQKGVIQRLVHGADQPLCPTTRPLQDGDIIICEFHVSYGGYLTAVELSVFVGNPPRELVELHKVAVECLLSGMEKFRPGVTLRELWEAIRAPVVKADMDFLELGFHGHGVTSLEFPSVVYKPGSGFLAGDGIGDLQLEENMVFGTNIDIQDPRWRKDVGVMFGDTVLVTSGAPERLVGIPLDLPVKPA